MDQEFAQVNQIGQWKSEVDYVIDKCISRH
jgi:hypothetical protein